jgi:hypothetical protein
MWGITIRRVLPLIIAFEVQALANRERPAERIGVFAPCAGLAVVIHFSPRIGRKRKESDRERPFQGQPIAIAPGKLVANDAEVESVSL